MLLDTNKGDKQVNILDVGIWTTPLAKYYVLDYSYNTNSVLKDGAGLDIDFVKTKSEYIKYVPDPFSSSRRDCEEALIISESYGDKLFKELEEKNVVVRFVSKETRPRFHEEKWQNTNNIKRVGRDD